MGGEARIDTLERIWPPDDWVARTSISVGGVERAARLLGAAGGSTDPDDPARGGGRRANGLVGR